MMARPPFIKLHSIYAAMWPLFTRYKEMGSHGLMDCTSPIQLFNFLLVRFSSFLFVGQALKHCAKISDPHGWYPVLPGHGMRTPPSPTSLAQLPAASLVLHLSHDMRCSPIDSSASPLPP
jgi:hypothetical protein